MRRPAPLPSPTFVVACGALLLSLTGTGLADIAQLGRNAVGTAQLRPGAVTTPKIRNSAVTTAKLRNRSVTLGKLAVNARVPGPRGPEGPAGPPGPPGPPVNLADGSVTTLKLADGSVTAAKLANNAVTASKIGVTYRSRIVNAADGSYVLTTQACNPNEKLIGGGAHWSGGFNPTSAEGTHLLISNRVGGGWQGAGINGSGSQRSLTVTAICVVG
jgi:hypothetical protein